MKNLKTFESFTNERITQTQKEWVDMSIINGLSKEDLIASQEKILKKAPKNQIAKNILSYLKTIKD